VIITNGFFAIAAPLGCVANPAKFEDCGDKRSLEHIDLARAHIGEFIPLRWMRARTGITIRPM
jgi:hypothetical protein